MKDVTKFQNSMQHIYKELYTRYRIYTHTLTQLYIVPCSRKNKNPREKNLMRRTVRPAIKSHCSLLTILYRHIYIYDYYYYIIIIILLYSFFFSTNLAKNI